MSQTESKKIKVLVLPSDRSGVGKFRSVDPHVMLQNLYPDDFHVDIDYEPKIHDVRYWKNYQIVHFHRAIGHDYNTNPTLIKNLRSLGIVTIMDLDDYWLPTKEHPIHSIILQDRIHEKILANLREVDYVTTTTKFFADEIRKHNKNVIVLPNAIDPNEKQFNVETEPSDRIRVGWLGGSSHLADLKLLNGFVDKNTAINNKIQYVLCGFDTRGTITEINNETGERKQRNIRPEETVWARYEEIFTNKYKIVDPKYKAHLLTYNQVEYLNEQSMPYRRVWTKPVNEYAANYGKFDISLAPIMPHIFNNCKCIVGEALISTNNGIYHIKDLVENKKYLNTEINGNENKIINHFKYENVPTIKITTYNGYEIEGTPHHKILINGEWIKLEDLKIGDKIELTKPIFKEINYKYITYPMLLTKNITQEKIDNSDENMIPRIVINEKWGRLLGYMLGDGHYNGKSSIDITCDIRHTEVVNDVIGLFKSIGLNPLSIRKQPDKRCINSLAKEGYGVTIKSTCINFLSIAKKYNWCGSYGKNFSVPKIILESPKSVIREFLIGLFEADGTVDNNGVVSFTTKDKKLANQVQYLLLGFGIESKINHSYNKHYRKYYYTLSLRRLGSEIFKKELGFISKQKKEKLLVLDTNKHSNNEYKNNMTDEITIIEHKHNDVYDIEVDDVHSYNANGIINHNSQLKVIEAGFHKKALIASEIGPYTIDLKHCLKNGEFVDGNALLVPEKRNHSDWAAHIKKLVNNPNLIKDMGERLYETVKDTYDLRQVTKTRADFYKSFL